MQPALLIRWELRRTPIYAALIERFVDYMSPLNSVPQVEHHWVSFRVEMMFRESLFIDFLRYTLRTVLSSAGNDGRVRLWKASAGSVWRAAGHISVEQAEEQQKDDVEMDDANAE